MKPIFIGALIAGGAYFLLKDNIGQFFKPAPAAAPTPAPAATPTPAAATPAAVGTLAALKAHMTATGNGALLAQPETPDVWNYYLMELYPSFVAPPPEDIFPKKANVREAITINTWFTAIAPFLTTSGLAAAPRHATAQPMRYRAGRQAWS